ncbi:MAG TPA: ATP-binding protein [Pyrinomonadaceae bacterium]|jgi:two-component system sensor histidine kinase KdpD|nr:ATP-binding protein [Pyrinomonadaceae bacterium]
MGVWIKGYEQRRYGYLVAVIGVIVVTAVLKLFGEHINSTTVGLGLLLVVLLVATLWGSRPAVLASLLGVVCFNLFYLPPVGRLTIDDPDNWIALFAFLVTAVTAGQLSAHAKRRAEEADEGRREIERLYTELQEAFERASQAKALEQSERLKSALLDAVTHDLRTPLTSIKASVTTLLDDPGSKTEDERIGTLDADGRREMLEVIDEESDRLNRFVEGLMELARIEAGEMHLRRRWGSVEEIVTTALERAAPLTRDHRIDVTLDEGLPTVRVDDRAVAEVIYTLVDNAAKYSPVGTKINVVAKSADDQMVRLSVEDEGQGIPLELRERVFDKFFRAMRDGDSGTREPSGSGMGLAIAKGIVEAHGGRIWIEDNTAGRGSRFVVTLPVGVDVENGMDDGRVSAISEDERQAAHSHH